MPITEKILDDGRVYLTLITFAGQELGYATLAQNRPTCVSLYGFDYGMNLDEFGLYIDNIKFFMNEIKEHPLWRD